jgi:hypothetical protein
MVMFFQTMLSGSAILVFKCRNELFCKVMDGMCRKDTEEMSVEQKKKSTMGHNPFERRVTAC